MPQQTAPANKICALVVDDQISARRAMTRLLETDADILVTGQCTTGADAVRKIVDEQPDVVFLDAKLPDMDGGNVIQNLGAQTPPVVVFLTDSKQHALKAFEINAVDCLLKPLVADRFWAAVRRAKSEVNRRRTEALGNKISNLLSHLQTLEARAAPAAVPIASSVDAQEPITRERILLKTGGEIFFLKAEEIDWIEAEGDYMKFHAGGRVHQLRETMGRLEERLDGKRFLRIHRSTIVNIDRVKKLSPDFAGEYAVVLHDGTKLRLSRGYHGRLQELMRDAL